jgi:hypothetical protein
MFTYGELEPTWENRQFPADYPALCYEYATEADARMAYPDKEPMERDTYTALQRAKAEQYASELAEAEAHLNDPPTWWQFWRW